MRNEWTESSYTMGGLPCIAHAVTNERSIFGEHGEIYLYSDSAYKVIIFSPVIAKKYLPKAQWPIMPGDETVIKIKPEEVAVWAKRLRVPRFSSSQVRLANKKASIGYGSKESV